MHRKSDQQGNGVWGEHLAELLRKRTFRKFNVGYFSCLSHLSGKLAGAEVVINDEISKGSLNIRQYWEGEKSRPWDRQVGVQSFISTSRCTVSIGLLNW